MDFKETSYSHLSDDDAAHLLNFHGYRQISGKFGIISRVDMTDEALLDYALAHHLLDIESIREQYRRCCATDRVDAVPQGVMNALRSIVHPFIRIDKELV